MPRELNSISTQLELIPTPTFAADPPRPLQIRRQWTLCSKLVSDESSSENPATDSQPKTNFGAENVFRDAIYALTSCRMPQPGRGVYSGRGPPDWVTTCVDTERLKSVLPCRPCRYCAYGLRRFPTNEQRRIHERDIHGVLSQGDYLWFCPLPACTNAKLVWIRRDSFRRHLQNEHSRALLYVLNTMRRQYDHKKHDSIEVMGHELSSQPTNIGYMFALWAIETSLSFPTRRMQIDLRPVVAHNESQQGGGAPKILLLCSLLSSLSGIESFLLGALSARCRMTRLDEVEDALSRLRPYERRPRAVVVYSSGLNKLAEGISQLKQKDHLIRSLVVYLSRGGTILLGQSLHSDLIQDTLCQSLSSYAGSGLQGRLASSSPPASGHLTNPIKVAVQGRGMVVQLLDRKCNRRQLYEALQVLGERLGI